MKRILLIGFLLSAFAAADAQQLYPGISQYLFNGLTINPAYAGSREVFTISTGYRNQWTGFEGAPVTQTLSMHTPLKNKNICLGLQLYNDRIGVSRETAILADYAYRLRMKHGRLAFGLSSGVSMRQSDWAQIDPTTSGDEVFQGGTPTYVVPEAGFGMYYKTHRSYIGFSIPRMISHAHSLEKDRYRSYFDTKHLNYLFTTGMLMTLSGKVKFYPSILVKYESSLVAQTDINATFIIDDVLWAGVSYRSGDAVVGLVQFYVNKQLSVGYSYDHTITDLSKYNSGSHEIFLKYEFGYKVEVKNPRFF